MYLFCRALTAVSISSAGVSFASVTTAESVRRSSVPGPDGGIILTPSTGKVAGRIALIAAGDVPGGREDRRMVGFGIALSCVLV